jgi:gluconate 5-dehydrogenase
VERTRVNDWLGLGGRTVLVAGAGGLGGASAEALAGLGARVVAVDVNPARLAELERRVRDQGGQLDGLAADLADPQACRRVVKEAAGRLGSVQVFLHAVGRNNRQPILDLDDAAWADLVSLNLSTAYWTGQAVGREMCAAGYGRMIFLSSVSGLLAHAHHAPYAATKGGLNQLVRVMAREWAPRGVTVNAVAPGYIETGLTRDYLAQPQIRQGLTSLVPAGRLGTTGEVADAVCFLASDRASFVTGHILYVDGGRILI